MIDANIVPKLIEILAKDDNATWVIANLTSGGTPDQIKTLNELNIIPPLCELVTEADSLTSLLNILKIGDQKSGSSNPYALKIRECGGLDKIKNVLKHEDAIVSQIAALIIKTFFNQEIGTNLVPQVNFVFFLA